MRAAFWDSIRQLYEQALDGSDDALLAKATAGLLHPATFGALKAAGMSVDEAAAVVAGSFSARAGSETQASPSLEVCGIPS